MSWRTQQTLRVCLLSGSAGQALCSLAYGSMGADLTAIMLTALRAHQQRESTLRITAACGRPAICCSGTVPTAIL